MTPSIIHTKYHMQFQKNQAKAQTSAFWLRSGVWTLAFALFMMLIYPTFDLDFHLSNLFFDAQQQRFTLRGHPILNVWLHTGIKWVMVCVALVSLALAISAHWLVKLKPYQSALFWVFIGLVLSTSAVAILKHDSMHACPWDLTIYGGDLPFFDLFKNPPAGTKSGGCFPAGHPSGGLRWWLFTLLLGGIARALPVPCCGLASWWDWQWALCKSYVALTFYHTCCGAAGWCGLHCYCCMGFGRQKLKADTKLKAFW